MSPSDNNRTPIIPPHITNKIPSTADIKEKLPSKEELKNEVVVATKSSLSGLRSLAAGGVGGVCAVLVGHPFDLVKVRLQTAEKGVYSGAMDVVRRTVAREGLVRVCSGIRLTTSTSAERRIGHVRRCFCTISRRDAYVYIS